MYKLIAAVVLLFACSYQSYSQELHGGTYRTVNLSAAIGKDQGAVSVNYQYNWQLGQRKKFELGVGARWTIYSGSKKDFLTAGPARYTRSFTLPFVIFFAGQKDENFDTLTVQRPLTHSLNAMFNMGYHLTSKFYAGFNIDMVGFSFGRKSSAIFTSSGTTQTEPRASVVPFNLLLTGDHDRGSLNSEFYLRYQLSNRIGLTALYQFLFIEYETNTVEQRFDDGKTNTRFRNKANNVGIGISYFLK